MRAGGAPPTKNPPSIPGAFIVFVVGSYMGSMALGSDVWVCWVSSCLCSSAAFFTMLPSLSVCGAIVIEGILAFIYIKPSDMFYIYKKQGSNFWVPRMVSAGAERLL